MHIDLGDDEAAVLLDALRLWRDRTASQYDADDQARYIAAANRIADQLGCVYPAAD